MSNYTQKITREDAKQAINGYLDDMTLLELLEVSFLCHKLIVKRKYFGGDKK